MTQVTKYSLKKWVLILTLTPTLFIGFLLTSYFVSDRLVRLNQNLEQKSEMIAQFLAISSELMLLNNDSHSAYRLITNAEQSYPNIITDVAIFDKNNKLFTSTQMNHPFDKLQLPEINHVDQMKLVELHQDNLVIWSPIIRFHPENQFDKLQTQLLGYVVLEVNRQHVVLDFYRSTALAIFVLFGGLFLNILCTLWLFKWFKTPIQKMIGLITEFSKGNFEHRLPDILIGELDSLKDGIHQMADSLAKNQQQMQQNIEQATAGLRTTLDQIETQNVQLDLAKKRALAASRTKSEFLANMSHELRTPLNGIIGFTQQLLKSPLQRQQRENLDTIAHSATNLLTIINDILDFSKLDAGKLTLEDNVFDLIPTIDETVRLLSESAYRKQLEFIVEIDPTIPQQLQGDAMRLQQIITNLIGNAIKFTAKGHIQFKLTLSEDEPHFVTLHGEVSDSGIGITDEQKTHLFQAFEQGDSSISRRFGGTGLGLVITKRLVQQMGGRIGLDPKPQFSTCFWFTLKFGKSDLAPSHLISNVSQHQNVLIFEPRQLSQQVLDSQLLLLGVHSEIYHPSVPLKRSRYEFLLIAPIIQYDALIDLLQQAQFKTLIYMSELTPARWLQEIQQRYRCQILSLPLSNDQLQQCLQHKSTSANTPVTLPRLKAETIEANHILCVDDNEANLKLISTLLEPYCEKVEVLSHGEAAVNRCQVIPFDLIFMDIQMPELDGIQATQRIRQQSKNQQTPIIAVTAHAHEDERRKILTSGFHACITKPISEETLLSTLQYWTLQQTHQQSLDWSLALQRAAGKEALAREMVTLFLEEVDENYRQICNQSFLTDLQLTDIVHKLHGATCYSGMPTLQALCAQLESALKQGIERSQLEPEILELQDELIKVKAAIKQILAI